MFTCVEELDVEIYSDSDSKTVTVMMVMVQLLHLSKSKSRLGATTYKTKFNSQWIKEFPCMFDDQQRR